MKVITVYHNKGGVGKTTIVVNLAAALSKKGKRILVIDLDSQSNATFATGLIKFEDEKDDDLKNANIQHVLETEDKYFIHEVVRKSQFNTPEIDVVPSHIMLMEKENEFSRNRQTELIFSHKLKHVENQYDFVLIDTPPALNLYARVALTGADYLIIPSDLRPFANQLLTNVKNFVKDNNIFRKFLNKRPIQVLGVLPSKIPLNSEFRQHTLPKRIENVRQNYALPVMSTSISESSDLGACMENIIETSDGAIPHPKSIFDRGGNSRSVAEFEALADELLQKTGEL